MATLLKKPKETATLEEFVNCKEGSQLIGVGERTLINYANRGLITTYRLRSSRLLRFRKSDLLKLLEVVKK